ncbi:hypothetical protein V1478_013182 [Vespula squamosa]|uniref:Uncharacterized protein n=1 Tax=Vespula squamosa TaxID=30214 RepID=A0ABD2AA34_VESSQ
MKREGIPWGRVVVERGWSGRVEELQQEQRSASRPSDTHSLTQSWTRLEVKNAGRIRDTMVEKRPREIVRVNLIEFRRECNNRENDITRFAFYGPRAPGARSVTKKSDIPIGDARTILFASPTMLACSLLGETSRNRCGSVTVDVDVDVTAFAFAFAVAVAVVAVQNQELVYRNN